MINYDEKKIEEMYQACTTKLSEDIVITKYDLFTLAVKNLMTDAFVQGVNYVMNEMNNKLKKDDQKYQ